MNAKPTNFNSLTENQDEIGASERCRLALVNFLGARAGNRWHSEILASLVPASRLREEPLSQGDVLKFSLALRQAGRDLQRTSADDVFLTNAVLREQWEAATGERLSPSAFGLKMRELFMHALFDGTRIHRGRTGRGLLATAKWLQDQRTVADSCGGGVGGGGPLGAVKEPEGLGQVR